MSVTVVQIQSHKYFGFVLKDNQGQNQRTRTTDPQTASAILTVVLTDVVLTVSPEVCVETRLRVSSTNSRTPGVVFADVRPIID